MPTPDKTPELTSSQRNSIFPGPGNPDYARGPLASMLVLEKMGLVHQVSGWSVQGKRSAPLTAEGKAVRAILAQEALNHVAGKSKTTIPLPTSVPWEAAEDRPHYVARLWLEAGRCRREAGRLEAVVLETLAEAERIEALARTLEGEMANAGI